MSDVSYILIWWLVYFVIGIIFLPVTFIIFRNFADRGYIFAKIIGILLSSYIVWLLGSLHILAFDRITILLVLLAATLINLWLVKGLFTDKSRPSPLKLIFLEECLFLLGLAFWSFVRAHEPSIRGLEKFMDFGFMNSILRSSYFPPADMWLTKSPDYSGGYFINYYYFGHYVMAYLTKLSGLDPAVTYNLLLSSLFASTFTLSFSIGTNLYYLYLKPKTLNLKPVFVGLLAAFLVALGGNPHTLYSFTAGYPNEEPVPPWKLELGIHPERYWYPNATRFVPFTIHEFPIYSFVVADIHGHVSDIPFVLTTIALLLAMIIREPKKEKEDRKDFFSKFFAEFTERTNTSFGEIILLGLLLGVCYMTNAWDGLIYIFLSGLVFLYLAYKSQLDKLPVREKLTSTFYKTFSASLFLLFFFLVANLPFSLNFKPFVSGIGVLCAPNFLLGKTIGPFLFETGKCQKSAIYMLSILWGFFYFNVISFIVLIIIPNTKTLLTNNRLIRLLKQVFKRNSTNQKFKHLENNNRIIGELNVIDIFVLLLILISTLLLIFPEFFYIKDIYPAHYRANTMFKLGYQAFMILGLVSAYIFMRIRQYGIKNIQSIVYYLLFTVLFFLVAIYPYFAINSYYGNLKNYLGLYGLNWLQDEYLDDYNAVVWLNKNVSGQPVIAEANGDSYTNYDRVSANTGLPTIVGWPVHEWLWRGSYDEAGKRIPEVAAIYESKDMEETKGILKKYNVEYIFLGALEREKYKDLNEEKVKNLGKVVFESGNTKVIKISL